MMNPLFWIDATFETNPKTIIKKLESHSQEYYPDCSRVPALEHLSSGYQGDDDYDLNGDLEDIIFSDFTPTRFFIPSPHTSQDLIEQEPTPSCFLSIPSDDDGYEADDDDVNPAEELCDDIFGDITPSPNFFSSSSRLERMKDNYRLKLPPSKDIRTCSSSSFDNPIGSEDDKMESHIQLSKWSSSASSDKESNRNQGNVIDSLKETALALRSVFRDLNVIETYDRLAGDGFGDVLVEVCPKSTPEGPTLVAYKDAYGQLTIPLEMGCNQYAAATLRMMTKDQSIDSINQYNFLCVNSWQNDDDRDIFVSTSKYENNSEFESCSEEELMSFVEDSYSRGHKRSQDELISYEVSMKTLSNSHHKIQRIY